VRGVGGRTIPAMNDVDIASPTTDSAPAGKLLCRNPSIPPRELEAYDGSRHRV
jgi:hypothetical protein